MAEIHGAHVGQTVRTCEGAPFQFLECGEHLPEALPLVLEIRVACEHEFISATEIGRFGVIAVMAEIQRNVGIAVALSGMPRGFAIAKGMSR